MSLSNFLFAPEEVQQSIVGMDSPTQDTDQITVDIEPVRMLLFLNLYCQVKCDYFCVLI